MKTNCLNIKFTFTNVLLLYLFSFELLSKSYYNINNIERLTVHFDISIANTDFISSL